MQGILKGLQRLPALIVESDLCGLQQMSPETDQCVMLSLFIEYCPSHAAFFGPDMLSSIQQGAPTGRRLDVSVANFHQIFHSDQGVLPALYLEVSASFLHVLKVTWVSTGTSPAGSAHSCNCPAEGTAGGCCQEEGRGRGPEGGRHEDGPGCRSRHGRAGQQRHEVQRPAGQPATCHS